jgi:hypothetical protein
MAPTLTTGDTLLVKTLGWTVLTFLFVDELLAMAAFGVWGFWFGVIVSVFCLATLALWHADRPGWALAFFVFSVVVNGLSLLPSVRSLVPTQEQVITASK